MHIKKVTKKDRYGNQVTTEYEVPEKSLDYTELLKKKMELNEPDMEIDIMSMSAPPVMGEEFNMGDPNNHPGEPIGSDTVPAWLTPGEFVVNKEATEMFGPEIEAMNEVGKMAKGGQVQYHADGAPVRGSAAQIMAGMDPAQIVRMMGNLGNAYQYLAPALGMAAGGNIPSVPVIEEELIVPVHSGGLDQSGGHHDWKRGGYHYHRGNSGGGRSSGSRSNRNKDQGGGFLSGVGSVLEGAASIGGDIYDRATESEAETQARRDRRAAKKKRASETWQGIGADTAGGASRLQRKLEELESGNWLERNMNSGDIKKIRRILSDNGYLAEGGDVPMPMSMTDALLHSREGFRDDVYLDSLGKPTVGYGHLLGSEYADKVGTTPFTQDELDSFFAEDRETAESAAKRNVGEDTWKKLNKRQKATLSSMAFQLGEKGQSKFKNMIKAIQNDDYREAAKQALTGSKGGKSKWLKQTPVRALDLAEAFDPDLAAQYRDAGGVVYDDMPVQYAFLGKLLGEPAEPTPEINWQGNAGMLSDLINAGYTPEQAIAAIKNIEAGEEVVPIEGELAAPPVAAPLEGDTVAKHAEEDLIDDFLWGAANPLDPFGFTRPEEEGGNEITWEDVGNVALGDKGREALGMPPRTPEAEGEIGGAADWWKGKRQRDKEAAEQFDDEVGGVPSAVLDEDSGIDPAAPPAPEGLEGEAAFGAGSFDPGELEDEDLLRQYKQVDEVIAADDEELAKAAKIVDEAKTPAEQQLERNKIMAQRWAGMAAAIEENPKVGQLMAGKSPDEIKNAGENQLKADPTITEQVRSYLEESPLGKEIGGALGSFFDAGELTKMAVYVAGSMAFGASPMNAMNFGMKQYLNGLSTKASNESAAAANLQKQAFEAAKTGKFTQQSILDFQKSGNPAVLVSTDGKDPMLELAKTGRFTRESMAAYQQSGNPLDLIPNTQAWTVKEREKQVVDLKKADFTDASIASYLETGNPGVLVKTGKPAKPPTRTGQKVWVQGLGNTEVWDDGTGKQFFKQKDGKWAPLDQTTYGNYDKATMGDAAIEARASQHISELEGVANQGHEKGDKDFINIPNTQLASEYNRIFQQQLKGTVDPERSQSVIKERMDEATQVWMDQYTTAVRNGTKKPTIDALESIYNSAIVARNNNISASALYGTSPANQTILENKMKEDPDFGDSSTQQVYQTAFAAWGRVPEGDQEKYAKQAEKLGGYSPFMLFMRDLLEGKSSAEQYLIQ